VAQEAEAVAVREHGAGYEVEPWPNEAVFVPRRFRISWPSANHRLEPRLERAPVLLRVDLELRGERFERERMAGALQRGGDLVAARDLVLVVPLGAGRRRDRAALGRASRAERESR